MFVAKVMDKELDHPFLLILYAIVNATKLLYLYNTSILSLTSYFPTPTLIWDPRLNVVRGIPADSEGVHLKWSNEGYILSHDCVKKVERNTSSFPISSLHSFFWRMVAWSMELSEFGLKLEPNVPVKAQCLVDFITKHSPFPKPDNNDGGNWWMLYVDGS
ncbi:hypothetical protein JHK82_018025 [Glycine max]|nr:hypothetical protein JHK82_018025 [Glycine max]